jgi:tetratricopeptide (TPR) repeat protein
MTLSNEGEALNALGRFDEAREAFAHAIQIWRAAQSDPSLISVGLTGIGLSYLGAGKFSDALNPLEEALRIRTTKLDTPEHLGETRFALARALWSSPANRQRARSLAVQARADYQVKNATTEAARIEQWLKASFTQKARRGGRVNDPFGLWNRTQEADD